MKKDINNIIEFIKDKDISNKDEITNILTDLSNQINKQKEIQKIYSNRDNILSSLRELIKNIESLKMDEENKTLIIPFNKRGKYIKSEIIGDQKLRYDDLDEELKTKIKEERRNKQLEYLKEYKIKNKEKYNKYAKEYYKKNKKSEIK